MIGAKIALVGCILLVVGAMLYFVAMGDTRAKYGEFKYDYCNSANGPGLPECEEFLKYQKDHPLKVWGFILGIVGMMIMIVGILVALLLRRPHKEKIVEKVLYKCPSCGAENETNNDFCKKCGYSLKAPKKPEPLPIAKAQ